MQTHATIKERALQPASASLARVPATVWALALYLVGVILLLARSFVLADHHFIYALDDTYIHMAIAKHFAGVGVWGVTPFGFTSATSSPLFDLLLASGYFFTGPVIWLPLLISFGFGVAAIFMADRMLPSESKFRTVALLAFVLLTPLPSIGVLGMEHTLQIFLDLAFIWRATIAITQRRSWDNWLLVIGPLLV
ncbi:MAG: hypothetical protein WA634_02895, partial [Silvibacterium sp.]